MQIEGDHHKINILQIFISVIHNQIFLHFQLTKVKMGFTKQ